MVDIESLKPEMLEHARQVTPAEACGLVAVVKGRQKYFPCTNLGELGEFILDPKDYARVEALGEIVAVFHSHPKTAAEPSDADKTSCESSGLPWVICNPDLETWVQFNPSGYQAPLIGRQYSYGVLDCVQLLRDWYKKEYGLTFPYLLPPHNSQSWHDNPYLYETLINFGFKEVDKQDIRYGDLLLMCLGRSQRPNHGAIYLGDNLILHHLSGRLSSRDFYNDYWIRTTHSALRYYGHA